VKGSLAILISQDHHSPDEWFNSYKIIYFTIAMLSVKKQLPDFLSVMTRLISRNYQIIYVTIIMFIKFITKLFQCNYKVN
jgi:hypothetical protein